MEDLEHELLSNGYAHCKQFATSSDCAALRETFDEEPLFRSRVVMERHNFGRGEYKYYAYPLPHRVAQLRESLYAALAPVANRWNERLHLPQRYPAAQQQYLFDCAGHGQTRPTALILRYGAGDYNCLHQDTYGELAFPFQATLFLSSRDDYAGGEFVLTEQRPRAQTRAIVITPGLGDLLIIPNRYRPVAGKSGYYRTTFRHGVSEIRSGERYALGIIFHDAQ